MVQPHPAMLWEPIDGEGVRCLLCGRRCVIASGQYGVCRVRRNVGNELKTYTYGALVALNVDPIEKKPLFHVMPGTRSLSIAAPGCNFQCEFCQNWQISQAPRLGGEVKGQAVSPEQIVSAAVSYDCPSISYTYTEPTVFFELAYDTAGLAHQKGVRNCFISNGYLTPAGVEKIAPFLDAINVDLKAFRDETYRRVMKARLQPVLECLKALAATGIWLEITTLIVPGMNDSEQELADIAGFISGELGRHVPWHVTRFHGAYHMTEVGSTPLASLMTACRIGLGAGLKYVYCGNVTGQADECTYCPSCNTKVIGRVGYSVQEILLKAGRCPACSTKVEGLWERLYLM
jgi:pyruvate formate lyase activating enzyme